MQAGELNAQWVREREALEAASLRTNVGHAGGNDELGCRCENNHQQRENVFGFQEALGESGGAEKKGDAAGDAHPMQDPERAIDDVAGEEASAWGGREHG